MAKQLSLPGRPPNAQITKPLHDPSKTLDDFPRLRPCAVLGEPTPILDSRQLMSVSPYFWIARGSFGARLKPGLRLLVLLGQLLQHGIVLKSAQTASV